MMHGQKNIKLKRLGLRQNSWRTNYGITLIIKIKSYVNLCYFMCHVSLLCFGFFIKHRDENTLTDLSLGVFTVMNLLPPFNLIYSPVQLWFVI